MFKTKPFGRLTIKESAQKTGTKDTYNKMCSSVVNVLFCQFFSCIFFYSKRNLLEVSKLVQISVLTALRPLKSAYNEMVLRVTLATEGSAMCRGGTQCKRAQSGVSEPAFIAAADTSLNEFGKSIDEMSSVTVKLF